MRKNRTIFLFIISIVVALVALGTFLFFFKVIKNKNEHTSAVLATLESKVAQKENAKAILEKVAEIQTTKEKIDAYFVRESEVDSFINYLENLADPIGASVKVESFDIPPNTKDSLAVKITSHGSFSKMMSVLVLLENAPYKIRITRTYFNKLLAAVEPEAGDSKEEKKQATAPLWQLEVSFTVLTE